MGGLTIRTPAMVSDCLDMAKPTRHSRRCAVLMWRKADTAVAYEGDKPRAVLYLWPHGDNRFELSLAISPNARSHMRQLSKVAQLTVNNVLQNGGTVEAHVNPTNRAGQRLAKLIGLHHAGSTLWQASGETTDG